MTPILEKSQKKKWAIKLITNLPNGDSYSGVVLHYTKSIIAIREYDDFRSDGLIFFPRKVITEIRDGEFEECENKILRMSGEIKASRKLKWLSNINNLKDLFSYLHTKEIWPAVETFQNSDDAFYLGPITKVTSSSIWLYCYDAAGKWEGEYNIKNKDVIRVEINSHYVDCFNNYMMTYNQRVQETANSRRS
jgi:hypothetical protein